MFFILAWLAGYNLTVSTVNSITCIVLWLTDMPVHYYYLNLISYFVFDMVTGRLERNSERVHHIMSLLSLLYVWFCLPDLAGAAATLATCLEVSTVPLNFFHESRKAEASIRAAAKARAEFSLKQDTLIKDIQLKDKPVYIPELPAITEQLSTQNWFLLFVTCFFVFRFPVFIYSAWPVLCLRHEPLLKLVFAAWVSLNSYWLFKCIRGLIHHGKTDKVQAVVVVPTQQGCDPGDVEERC